MVPWILYGLTGCSYRGSSTALSSPADIAVALNPSDEAAGIDTIIERAKTLF